MQLPRVVRPFISGISSSHERFWFLNVPDFKDASEKNEADHEPLFRI